MTRPRFGPSASASGEFDFYVLALSWSPGFCELSGGGRSQCEPGARLGFVVHGLWPQYEHGFPSNCGGSPTVSRMALDRAKGVYPDDGLARYEWRKHGTCTGLSPGDYFAFRRQSEKPCDDPAEFPEFLRRPDIRHAGRRARLHRGQSALAARHDERRLPARAAAGGSDLRHKGFARFPRLPGGGARRLPLPRNPRDRALLTFAS